MPQVSIDNVVFRVLPPDTSTRQMLERRSMISYRITPLGKKCLLLIVPGSRHCTVLDCTVDCSTSTIKLREHVEHVGWGIKKMKTLPMWKRLFLRSTVLIFFQRSKNAQYQPTVCTVKRDSKHMYGEREKT